jgi:uncharacterized repeat protein (TIGR03803 family)
LAISTSAQTLETVFDFDGSNGGDSLYGLMIQGLNGRIYGTTGGGGPSGFGTFFNMTPAGDLTSLYDFCTASCDDGGGPIDGVIQALDGNFYGITTQGGANSAGTVFKITPTGTFTLLYTFCSLASCADGSTPISTVAEGSDHNFYGTTSAGGANSAGTIFMITPMGALTTLYNFCSQPGCTDGGNPYGGLVQASDGNFYGATQGTLYRITPGGVFTLLYSFCATGSCNTGAIPYSSLIQGTDGNLWGTAAFGGYRNGGTVYRMDLSGSVVAYSICRGGACPNGKQPTAALVQATDGRFYGTTYVGGASSAGTIFAMDMAGHIANVYNFCSLPSCADGTNPAGGLMQYTTGALFGTTQQNGTGGAGTIYRLNIGAGPFVITKPTSGAIGSQVQILGTNLTGTTNVSFNGSTASFTVISASLIEATVPAGASTGTVSVTTPSATLNSNFAFQVTP